MILVIDNYDSFTYNLVQAIGALGKELEVYRNDAIMIKEIKNKRPTHIIISPGPCTPREAGISNDVVRYFAGKIPIMGVCLGHQCIGYVYQGNICHAPLPTHGKSSMVHHDGKTVYRNLPNPFEAGRYHSLVVNWDNIPDCMEITAKTSDGMIMGIRHRDYVIEGVQFHPESIMTGVGHLLLANFLSHTDACWSKE